MAARKRPGLSENTRLRIKTTMLVKRLTDHVVGNCEMSASQVRAAEILLRKTLPDVQTVQLEGGENPIQHQIADKPMSEHEWAEGFGVVPSEGSAARTH